MNIKSILPAPLTSVETRPKTDVKTEVRSQESSEREADGRRHSDDETPQRPMKSEEIEEVLKSLKELPGIKIHHLLIEVSSENDQQVVWIKDPNGQVIRRLTLHQLWQIYKQPDKGKGQIFDRAM